MQRLQFCSQRSNASFGRRPSPREIMRKILLPSTKLLLFSFLVPCHRTYGRRADLARFSVRRTATRNRPTVIRHTSCIRLRAVDSIIESQANCVIHPPSVFCEILDERINEISLQFSLYYKLQIISSYLRAC